MSESEAERERNPAIPDLQCSCAKNSGSLIFCHIRGRRALVVGHLFLPHLLHDFAIIACIGITRDYRALSTYGMPKVIFFVSIDLSFWCFVVFRVNEILGLVFFRLLRGLVVVSKRNCVNIIRPLLKMCALRNAI